jgi:hypothetical protein
MLVHVTLAYCRKVLMFLTKHFRVFRSLTNHIVPDQILLFLTRSYSSLPDPALPVLILTDAHILQVQAISFCSWPEIFLCTSRSYCCWPYPPIPRQILLITSLCSWPYPLVLVESLLLLTISYFSLPYTTVPDHILLPCSWPDATVPDQIPL